MSALPPKTDMVQYDRDVRFVPKADIQVECAPSGGHLAGLELTRTAGLSEDESHGQAPFP